MTSTTTITPTHDTTSTSTTNILLGLNEVIYVNMCNICEVFRKGPNMM